MADDCGAFSSDDDERSLLAPQSYAAAVALNADESHCGKRSRDGTPLLASSALSSHAASPTSSSTAGKKRSAGGRPVGSKDTKKRAFAPRKKGRKDQNAPVVQDATAPIRLFGEDAEEESMRMTQGEDNDDKVRPQMRALAPTPRVGVWQADALLRLHGLPLPWHLQQHVHARTDAWTAVTALPAQDVNPTTRGRMPGSGPFDRDLMPKFLRKHQLDFARMFAVPFEISLLEDMQQDKTLLQCLSAHDAAASAEFLQEKFASNTVLYAAQHTHGLIKLDHSPIPHIRHVDIRQFGEARESRLMRGGPYGGSAGCKRHTFFWISSEEAAMTTPDAMLRLMSVLCCLMQPDANKRLHHDVYPGVNTEYTELQVREGLIRSVRMSSPGEMAVMQKHEPCGVEMDIDAGLLESIQEARGARQQPPAQLTAQDCIPRRRNTHDPLLAGKPLPQDSDLPVRVNHTELFDVSLGLSIHRCVDSNGNLRRVKLNTLTVQENVVGIEFLLFLKQASKSGELQQELNTHLHEVLRHMNALLYQSTTIDIGQLFGEPTNHAHISDMLAEDSVLMGMMKYAKQENLLALNFGGLILRANQKAERRMFDKYLAAVREARRQALAQVSHAVEHQDCNTYASAKCRRLPLQHFALDGEVSLHYRSMPREHVVEAILELKTELAKHQKFADDQDRQMWSDDFELKWRNWLEEQVQDEFQGGNIYFAIQGAMCNYGLQLYMNASQFTYAKRRDHSVQVDAFPQPILVVPAVKILLHNALKAADPYERLLDGHMAIDRDTLMESQNVAGEMLSLRTVLQTPSREEMMGCTLRSLQQQQEMILLGKHLPEVQQNLATLVQYVNLEEACNIFRDTFRYGLLEILDEARKSELKQWSWTAAAVSELAEQGKQHIEAYTWDNSKSWQRTEACWDDGVWVGAWLEDQTAVADLKLSWKPHMVVRTIQMFHAAVFGRINNDAMWGATVSFSDMGNSMKVLGASKAGHVAVSRKHREEVLYDRKTPSCGADMCHNVSVNLEVAYNCILTTDKTVRAFFTSKDSNEYYTLHVSGHKATTWLGHGCKRDSNGNIVDGQWKHMIGAAGVMNELLKVNASSAQDTLSNIESALPHSSTNGHIQEQGADTNLDGKGCSTENIIHMPLKSKASNRFNRHTPKSLLCGGRQKSIMSPVQDGQLGVIINDLPGLPDVQGQASVQNRAVRPVQSLRSCSVHLQPAKEKQSVGTLSEEKARNLRAFCLFHAMNRRMVVFMHRSMSIGWKLTSYTFGMNWEGLMGLFLRTTQGIRRTFFSDSNNETWQRTFEGSFVTATAFPVWMQQNIARCLLFHMTRARASISMSLSLRDNMNIANLTSVNLKQAHEDALFGMQCHTLTFVAVASAMYMWLSMCVIDAAVMVLCCYQMHMIGFAAPCPLHILALAMNKQEMTKDEYTQYKQFCEFMLPLVTDGVPQRFAHVLPQAAIQPPTDEALENWLRVSGDQQQRFNNFRSRTGQDTSLAFGASVYVAPNISFVTTEPPDWIKTDPTAERKHVAKERTDEFVTGSMQTKLADLFARHQTQAACAQRPSGFRNTTTFWNAARKGVRWPRCEGSDSDKNFDFGFDDPETTGYFWYRTMEEIGSMQGPLVQFLEWCGCSEKTSRHDFFTRLFALYSEKEQQPVNIFANRAWNCPILHRKSSSDAANVRLPAFEWACWPHYDLSASHGVAPTQKGVQIALGIDVLQIVMAQIFCREWHHDSNIRTRSVVHLRNLGHAARELISMWVHTKVQETLLPLGSLLLQAPCPMNFAHGQGDGDAVEIVVRPAIHANRTIWRKNPDDEEPHDAYNVLEHNHRLRFNFRTVLQNGQAGKTQHALFYAGTSNEGHLLPPMGFAAFPFPPESVAHMLTHFEYLRWWTTLYRTQKPERCSPYVLDIANVVQVAGRSMAAGALGVVPLTLTTGLCSVSREIPCITFQQNRMFVLKLTGDLRRVRVMGVERTHVATEEWMEDCQWQPLTIENDDAFFLTPAELQLFMVDGFWYNMERGVVLHPSSRWWEVQSSRSAHRLPFMMFPAVAWSQVVLLTPSEPMLRTCLEDDEHEFVRIVSADDLYDTWELTDVPTTPCCSELLIAYSIDVVQMVSDGWDIKMLCVFGSPDEPTAQCPMWLSRGSGDTLQRFYFNSVLDMCHAVMAGQGDVSRDPARQSWVHVEVLVARTREFEATNKHSYEFGFLTWNEEQGHLEVSFHAYDDANCMQVQAQLRRVQQRLHSQKATLQARQSVLADKRNSIQRPDYSDEIAELQKEVEQTIAVCTATQAEEHALTETLRSIRPKQTLELLLSLEDSNTVEELDDIRLMRPARADVDEEGAAECILGLIQKSGRQNGYLSRGHYTIQYMDEEDGSTMHVNLDFVSASRCLLPECSVLYVRLDQELCSILLGCETNLGIPHDAYDPEKRSLQADVALRCFYVLGDMAQTRPVSALQAAVRLLVPVKECHNGEYRFTANRNKDYIAIFSRLYRDDYMPQVMCSPQGCPVVEFVERNVGSFAVDPPSSNRLWVCEEMRL